MSDLLHLLVDDRERNADLLAAFSKIDGVQFSSCRLSAGDFVVDQAVVIERKTAADFATSLTDGRLFSQASRLLRTPFRPAFIIEGTADQWAALKVKRHALQGALISLMLVFDIPVLRSHGPEETARLICYTAQQLSRARMGGSVPVRRNKARRLSTRQRRILQSLPGVGPDRAKRLLAHFGSVRACFSADSEELAAIPGIGPVTAQSIVESVQESQAQYGSSDWEVLF